MSITDTANEAVITSYAKAPAARLAGGVTYAYRELGPKGGIPVVFFVHLAATLDNWDPRIVDPIAKDHHVITFDNRGVGASTGDVPDSVEAMADDASPSSGRSALTRSTSSRSPSAAWSRRPWWSSTPTSCASSSSPAPAPPAAHRQVAGTTYFDMLRATLTRSDPKEFPFFNRNATGKRAARRSLSDSRSAPSTGRADHGEGVPDAAEGDQEVGTLGARRPVEDHPAHPDRQRRQRPHGALGALRRPSPPHHGVGADHLPRLGPWRHLPVPRPVAARRRRVPRPLTGIRSHEGTTMTNTVSFTKKPLASSILLWMRTDQPRQQGMEYWKGPHSKIISATPGFDEYRQLHLAATNPGPGPPPTVSRRPFPRIAGSTGSPRSPSPPRSSPLRGARRPGSRTKTR